MLRSHACRASFFAACQRAHRRSTPPSRLWERLPCSRFGLPLWLSQLGENVAVIGLGIVGQLAVQLLVANGCRVFAVDLDPDRVELARQAGAVDGSTADLAPGAPRPAGQGWDAAIVAADSKSEAPLTLAATLCRPKGRVIVVGLVRTDLPRQEFYDKELELTVSRSYGPGRYDPQFELKGQDYPYPYVRWTETRNLEAFVDLVARKRVDVERLISHQYPFGEAAQAYRLLLSRKTQMAILFEYADQPVERQSRVEVPVKRKRTATGGGFAFIGAGAFARTTLLPLITKYGFVPQTIANAGVVSARATAAKFGFQTVCSGVEEAIADERVDAVFIATPHASHSGQVAKAARGRQACLCGKTAGGDARGPRRGDRSRRQGRRRLASRV